VFDLSKYAQHRKFCGRTYMPGDEDHAPAACDCGLDAVLDSLRCGCGHRVDHHTDRDVSDVVGWPCIDCKSARCRGFAATGEPDPDPDPMNLHGERE